jgi:hypothetical protein
MLTREDLVRTTQQNQDSTENARAQLARFTEQSNDTLLHYNNTLAQLQSQLDKARAEGMIWVRHEMIALPMGILQRLISEGQYPRHGLIKLVLNLPLFSLCPGHQP